MALQRALAEAGGRVPETDRQVPAAGRKKPAVGRKGRRSDVQTAKSLKKIVLTYLIFQLQMLHLDRDGLLSLKALTHVLPACAGSNRRPSPTAVSFCQRCRTQ